MNDNFVEQQLREMSKTIKNIREIYGITQSHLANLMGVSRSVIADIEQEKRFPELFNLFKLCDALGITATELSAFTYQNWTMNINTDERAELHKEMFKSAQKTVYENAMEWRRKGIKDKNKLTSNFYNHISCVYTTIFIMIIMIKCF